MMGRLHIYNSGAIKLKLRVTLYDQMRFHHPMIATIVFLSLVCNTVAMVFPLERIHPGPSDHTVGMEVHRARDRARHARLLRSSDDGVNQAVHFNLSGSANPFVAGLYYTRVRLGTPPREYSLQIDTGSDLMWVACSSCSTCPQTSLLGVELNFFDIANSTTAHLLSCSDPLCPASSHCGQKLHGCDYSTYYVGHSGTSGSYVSDLVHLDMTAHPSTSVGCSTYKSGTLADSLHALDGLFGLDQEPASFVSQLASKGITPWAFSHCLKENGGGMLVFGEVSDPSIIFTPLVPSQPLYYVNLQSIAISGHPLPIDEAVFATSHDRGTFVDSGATLAYLPEEAFDIFISTINATVSPLAKFIFFGGEPCYSITKSLSDVFPPVSLNFSGGALMVLRPEEYLIDRGSVDGAAVWCMGFQKQQQGIEVTILGDLVLKNKIVVYDIGRQRIGWANYNCSLPINVSIDLPTMRQRSFSSSEKSSLIEVIFVQILLFIGFLMHFAANNEP